MAGSLAPWPPEITRIDREDVSRVSFLKTLFSTTGILIYILIGIFFNTASPHLPGTAGSLSSLHSWVQYAISVLFWPLGLWHPTFTLGKWTP